MPNLSVTLPETTQTILRPVVLDIVKQLQEITKFNEKSNIRFPGETDVMQTAGSELGTKNKEAIFAANNYTFIEIEEDFETSDIWFQGVNGNSSPPVFLDDKLNVSLSPIYASSKVTVNFKYRCPSKTEAVRWRDDMRIKVGQLRDINIHKISYTYFLPLELLTLIKVIHEKREAYLGYGESFQKYFLANSTSRLKLLSDTVGHDTRLGVAETQSRITGIYGFEGLPDKIERDEEASSWVISFSYSFTYDKPIGCNIKYPIMVHNQLLPVLYTHYYNKNLDLTKIDEQYSMQLSGLSIFENDNIMYNHMSPESYIRLPEFDDYVITNSTKGTSTCIMGLCEVDTTDKKTLLNLNSLGTIQMDKDILDFIRETEYPYICKLYNSFINVTLYRNEHPSFTTNIECDSNLNIKSIHELDLRNNHRVRISLITDLSLLRPEAIDRIKRHPKAFVKIIASMNDLLRNHPDLINLRDKNLISNLDFKNIYAILTGRRYLVGGATGLYYGSGLNVNEWPYYDGNQTTIMNNSTRYIHGATPVANVSNTRHTTFKNLAFADLDPEIVENYRRNNTHVKHMMVSGIIVHKAT